MQKITTHSKSGLFLMEMIFVLLFLGLTCGVCVRLFAASYSDRTRAREYNHIQELTTSVGEILEGTSGTADSFLQLMPDGTIMDDTIEYGFDKNWKTTELSDAVYIMSVKLLQQEMVKSAQLTFSKVSSAKISSKESTDDAKELYSLTIRYPIFSEKENAS